MNRPFRLLAALTASTIAATSNLAVAHGQEFSPPSQEEIEAARDAPLFASHDPLEVTLEADFHAIRGEDRSRDSDTERPAVLRWITSDGATGSLDIQLRTRGNFRLSKRNCDFPPLRLNLKEKSTDGTVFAGQDKLKLVVTCKLGQEYWEQYVLLEYMAYRMFHILTPRSFRVRLAKVTYVDTSGDDAPFTRFAFLIEDDSTMALRNNARVVDWGPGQLHPALLGSRPAVLVDFFEYMIGNTDWSGVEMHNMALIRSYDDEAFTVPYDFDFSGLVDARYATPDPSLKIRRVRQRLFRGFCPDQVNRPQADYDAVVALFQEKKDEIYQAWRNLEGLEPDRLKDSLEYLDEFYRTLSDPKLMDERMMRDCRKVSR